MSADPEHNAHLNSEDIFFMKNLEAEAKSLQRDKFTKNSQEPSVASSDTTPTIPGERLFTSSKFTVEPTRKHKSVYSEEEKETNAQNRPDTPISTILQTESDDNENSVSSLSTTSGSEASAIFGLSTYNKCVY